MSGCTSSIFCTPSGAATMQRSRIERASIFFSVVHAAAAEPPVASIGSSRKKSRCSRALGTLK